MTSKQMKVARAELEMTQADLAIALDMNSNTVSKYERGDLDIPRTVELAIDGLLCRQRERDSNGVG
jgi:DNA-binding XRE family transcriptional regulator